MANTTLEPDSEERQSQDAIQSAYDREFAGITGNYGAETQHPLGEQESSASAPIVGNGLRGRENKPAKSAADAAALKDKEEAAPDRSGFSAGDGMREKLGLGYTSKGSAKSKRLSKLYSSNSKFKKKIAIAGAAAGGSAVIGLLVFLAMLPLKIEHIVTNLESRFTATSENAMDKETTNLFNQFVTKQILPNLNKGACHSTLHPGCVAVAAGATPVDKLFNSWRQGKVEQKLASKYGIVFGTSSKSASGYVMTVKGHNFDISKDNIFDFPGANDVTRNEVRTAIRTGLKDATLWDKVYFRFKVGKLLETKYGIKRCIIACSAHDKFTDKVIDKKLAAKAWVINRAITPFAQNYGLVMQCLMAGADFCSNSPVQAKPGDDEKLTPFQQQLRTKLQQYASQDLDTVLSKVVGPATDISEKGFTKYIAGQAARSIASAAGVSADAAETAGEGAEKAIPIVGWASMAVQLVHASENIGPIVKYFGYATKAAAAVGVYTTYRTVAAEAQSGHMDMTELGSFNNSLSTNLSGSSQDQSDATSTPLYNNIMGDSSATTASVLSGPLATASADATSMKYACNDGSPVPAGQLICPEEKLSGGNSTATAVSDTINSLPGMSIIRPGVDVLDGIIKKVNGVIGMGFSFACNTLGYAVDCPALMNALGGVAGNFFSWFMNKLVPNPISNNMSGGRTFDMMAAGADVVGNDTCREQLGCSQLSTTAVTNIRNQQIAEEKQAFDSQNMFARVFSTGSPYSLISRLAMDMPTTVLSATNQSIQTLLTSPFHAFGSLFSNVLTGNHAFAATTAQPDPFGVPQSGYSDSDIPSDPETFWNQNCVAGPDGVYNAQTGQLDVSAWLNAPGNTSQDPDTGVVVNNRPNPCLLIQSITQSAGGLFDSSLLPPDSQNADTPSS